MNNTEKSEYVKDVSLYMEKNKVYQTFEHLYKLLITEKPDKPLDFLIK